MLITITRQLTKILLGIGVTTLMLMMFLTALDVILRYVFNRPLLGSFELVEYMMAITIPFCIVYCAEQKGHVAVDLVLARFPYAVRIAVDIVTTCLAMAFVTVIAWQNFTYIAEVRSSNLVSSVLKIPNWLFVIPVAVAIGVFALILLRNFFELIVEAKKL